MKVEGQNIPSEYYDLYIKTLAPINTKGSAKKRYPFRLPDYQDNGSKVTQKQKNQRSRFKIAKNNFATLTEAEKERWFAARPEWNSLLWYYNYFMMSELSGNANDTQGGVGVVKSIQVVSGSIATTGNTTININTIDASKSVVFLFGNSFVSDKIQRGTLSVPDGSTANAALSPSIDVNLAEVKLSAQAGFQDVVEGSGSGIWMPFYVAALSPNQITVGIDTTGKGGSLTCAYEIIEHKSQTVYPVIMAINNTNIQIGWPLQPDIAALISAIVIEYV